MKSNRTFSRLFAASCIMASFATASTVYATSAPVVLDLEGNPTCNSLAENPTIFEVRDTSPPDVGMGVDDGGTLTLHNGQKLTYKIDPDTTIYQWSLVEPDETVTMPLYPINFVILKGAGNAGARVFHYGQKGVTTDTDLLGPGTLKTVTFCYGLNGETISEEETVQDCDFEATGFQLEGIKIDCDLTGDQGVSFHAIKKGETLTYSECTCNETATVCDKSLPPGSIGACIPDCSAGNLDGGGYAYTFNDESYTTELDCLRENELNETPVGGIEPWNNGSGWCSSFSGSSSCKTW